MGERLEGNKRRKPYQKSQLSQVKLAAEEAVLQGCKVNNANIKTQVSGTNCDLSGSGKCTDAGT